MPGLPGPVRGGQPVLDVGRDRRRRTTARRGGGVRPGDPRRLRRALRTLDPADARWWRGCRRDRAADRRARGGRPASSPSACTAGREAPTGRPPTTTWRWWQVSVAGQPRRVEVRHDATWPQHLRPGPACDGRGRAGLRAALARRPRGGASRRPGQRGDVPEAPRGLHGACRRCCPVPPGAGPTQADGGPPPTPYPGDRRRGPRRRTGRRGCGPAPGLARPAARRHHHRRRTEHSGGRRRPAAACCWTRRPRSSW